MKATQILDNKLLFLAKPPRGSYYYYQCRIAFWGSKLLSYSSKMTVLYFRFLPFVFQLLRETTSW